MMAQDLFHSDPYGMPQKEKEAVLLALISELVSMHKEKCPPYSRLIHLFNGEQTKYNSLADLPYFPVNLFKTQKMISVDPSDVFKVLQSSGTTSMHPSKIYLDAVTAQRQTLALANIMTSLLGPKRLPMVVFDHPFVIKDRQSFSARGAAILGMLNFGRDVHYALDESMNIDIPKLKEWLQIHKGESILAFGLTFVVWEYVLSKLNGQELDLSEGILIHSGGWKKLQEKAVSNQAFKKKLYETTAIRRCHSFYGMVEQIGSVFLECEEGHLHSPSFADIIVRNTKTWQENPVGEEGVIQVLSALPTSYPGNSLLTEDVGVVEGIDNCPCGRKGKHFKVSGRVPKAEIRGCGDTYNFSASMDRR